MTEQDPTTGVIDPATGQPVARSGPSGGPPGVAAGTVARDVATRGTAGTEDADGPKDHIGDASDQAQDAADTVKEKASDAADQAQAKAQDAAGQAKDQLRTQLDQRSTQAGERATATAGDLRSISDHLKDQGNDGPAKLADQAALQIEKAGSYLERTDGSTLLDDVQSFARRNPWATALGGLAVGFAASRALKASTAERSLAQGGDRPALPTPPRPSPTPTAVHPGPSSSTAPATPGPAPVSVPPIEDTPAVTGYSVPPTNAGPGYEPPSGTVPNPSKL